MPNQQCADWSLQLKPKHLKIANLILPTKKVNLTSLPRYPIRKCTIRYFRRLAQDAADPSTSHSLTTDVPLPNHLSASRDLLIPS